MQQGNGQFVLPYTAHQVAASSGEMHIQDMGEHSQFHAGFPHRAVLCCWQHRVLQCGTRALFASPS